MTGRSHSHGCGGGWASDLWYKYVPTCTGTATISTCASEISKIALAIYDGCPDSGGSEIVCVDSGSCGDNRETVSISVGSGVPVYIAVMSNLSYAGDRTGGITLEISCVE